MRLFLSAVAAFGAFAIAAVTPASATPIRAESSGSYLVDGVHTLKEHNRIAAIGVSIDAVENGVLDISATLSEVRQLRGLGFPVTKMAATEDFPTADSKYHTYAEMVAELNQVVAAHPSIALKKSIGTSYEGRDLPIIKISDHVGADEHEPEVLYDAHQHAREHLTVEMALYLIHLFTDNYGQDPRITHIVNSRELWIVPDMNPDGGEYDIAAGTYRFWRKNRQPNTGTTDVGTDLNRNWGYQWGCCTGSSDSTSETYRGPSAFSSTEDQRLRDFVLSRRIGGVQQIKTNIDFHSYSELVLWPYGYTTATTGTGMNADQEATFRTLGGQLARSNGYTAERSSALYLVDGDSIDWMWATQGIVAYAFEMFPAAASDGGFYPPDEVIPAQTARNREASLQIAEYADCPYRIIGKQTQYCGSYGR